MEAHFHLVWNSFVFECVKKVADSCSPKLQMGGGENIKGTLLLCAQLEWLECVCLKVKLKWQLT